MESTGSFLEIVGLMMVLTVAAIVFVALAQWFAGKKRDKVGLGLKLVAAFALTYLLHEPAFGAIGLDAYVSDIAAATATLFWLASAFTLNAALSKYVWKGALTRRGEPMMPKLLTDAVAVFVYLGAIMIVMHFVYGEPITALVATSGAFAFVLGYSAQTTLGELFAGVSLQASRSIKKGDEVLIGDVFGVVHDVDWRSVSVHQYATNSIVVIPNSVLSTKPFTNFHAPGELIQSHVDFTVEYTAPPDLVVSVVTDALKTTRAIKHTEYMNVHPRETDTYGMTYRAMYQIEGTKLWFEAYTEAYSAIWSALRKHNIKPGLNHQFAGPGSQFDGNDWATRNADTAAERPVLAKSTLLSPLSDTELDQLLSQAIRQDFVSSNVISPRGAPGDTLFFLAAGHAAADMLYDEDGEDSFLANDLVPGEAFGLRAFRSGGVRTEQVEALLYSVVYAVPKDVFQPYLEKYPEIDQRISDAITERDEEAERRRKAHGVEITRRARLERKKDIAAGLSTKLGGLFKGGVFKRGPSKETIANGAMAAAALVAAADGTIETAERDAVIETFKDLDLFRYIDADAGLAKFDAYCKSIERDEGAGTKDAMAAVRELAETPELADLALDIAIAVSAADGEVEEPEEKRIEELRDLLGDRRRTEERRTGP